MNFHSKYLLWFAFKKFLYYKFLMIFNKYIFSELILWLDFHSNFFLLISTRMCYSNSKIFTIFSYVENLYQFNKNICYVLHSKMEIYIMNFTRNKISRLSVKIFSYGFYSKYFFMICNQNISSRFSFQIFFTQKIFLWFSLKMSEYFF